MSAVAMTRGVPGAWRTRTLVVALVAVLAGHLLAAAGLLRGMPEAPWGDESQYWSELAVAALRIVWMPWASLPSDAIAPAAFARGIVPLVLAWLAGEALARQLRNPLRLLRVARRGDHAVLLGLSPIARHVLAHWIEARRPAMVVSSSHSERAAAVAGGAAFLDSDWHVEDMPRRAALGRAASVACVSGTDVENIDAAVAMSRAATALRPAGSAPLVVFARVEDPFLRARIDERIDRFASLDRVQLRLFSAAQIAVRRLLREHPPGRCEIVGASAPHLWIVGFDALAEELAVQAIRLSPPGARVRVTVVDGEASEKRTPFLLRWPGAAEAAQLRFAAGHAEEGAALVARLLEGEGSAPSAIAFCDARPEANLAAALQFCGALQAAGTAVPPLYLRGRVGAAGGELAAHPWMHEFGEAAEVAEEFLLGERIDAAARAIHESYLAESRQRGEEPGSRRSLRPWLLLAEDLKDDNRALADHHFAKVRVAGCVLERAFGRKGVDPGWTDAEIEALAEYEHERWMTQRLLAGWRQGAVRNDAERVHPDLVPYAALADARRELDRAVVREIPQRMAELGYVVVRELPVTVSGPASPWAFAPAFEQAVDAMLAELRERASGRSPILWWTPKSAMAARVAEGARAAGLALGAVLEEPAATLLARQPTDEIRARLRALLRASSRVRFASGGNAPQATLQVRLSLDGSDLAASPEAWGLDAAGRTLFRPEAKP